ncbi:hypothetical protein ABPG72_015469 [Tetrahymena utriculariae]
MEFQVTDADKEKFRKYVERSGAIDQLVRALAQVYDSQQESQDLGLTTFKKAMGVNVDVDAEKLQADYNKLKEENFRLKKLIDQLQFEIDTKKNPK